MTMPRSDRTCGCLRVIPGGARFLGQGATLRCNDSADATTRRRGPSLHSSPSTAIARCWPSQPTRPCNALHGP
jgi:hypothetical protein